MQRPIERAWQALVGLILAFAALLLWPAAVNGGAFWFPDTSTYIRGVDAAVVYATGHQSQWSGEVQPHMQAAQAPTATDRPHGTTAATPVVLSGRSVYYGALLYVADLIGSFWFVVLVQALLTASAAILVASRVAGQHVVPGRLWPVLVIPLVTGVGLQVGLMMPDIFMPLGLLATAMIAILWAQSSRVERFFWVGLLATACLVHSANLLIIGVLLVGLVVWKIARRDVITLLPIALALATGVVGEIAFGAAVRAATGASPVRPPFMAARLIADGPGRDYLTSTCARGSTLTLCKYRHRIPSNSDAFLWSGEFGGFMGMPPEDRRRVAAEERRFVLGTLLNDPLAVASSSFRSVYDQMSRVQIDDVAVARLNRDKLPPAVRASVDRSLAGQGRFPTGWLNFAVGPVLLLSLASIAWLSIREQRSSGATQVRVIVVVLLAGMLLNAVVCGAISTPHDRYQTRVLWLLPLLAITLALRAWDRRKVRGPAMSGDVSPARLPSAGDTPSPPVTSSAR
jgi:hypothetical protein